MVPHAGVKGDAEWEVEQSALDVELSGPRRFE